MKQFISHLHLHDPQNKMVPLMMPFILVDLSNGVKFHSYIMKSCKFSSLKHN
jgi:hypothetical protein